MPTTLATNLIFRITTVYTDDNDLSDPSDTTLLRWDDALTNGTGDNQADYIWHDRRTATAAADDIDLVNLTCDDAFGTRLSFVTIKGIFIRNRTTTTDHALAVGGDAAPFVNWVGAGNDILNIGPDGLFMLWSPIDGYAVAGGADVLQIDPGANTIEYDIIIIGTSA